MGDGPERGNTRIERLLREEAMNDGMRFPVPVTTVNVWLCQYSRRTRIDFDVCNKSMDYCKAGILALHFYFIGLPALVLLEFRGGLTMMERLDFKPHLFRYSRNGSRSQKPMLRRS